MYVSSADSKRVLILTGDHSADRHAASIVSALKGIDPEWQVTGVGADAMQAAGVELIANHHGMNIIGPAGVLAAVPSHLRLGKKILRWVDEHRPKVVVLIDYGVFHLWLAPKLKARGVKVMYFVPPQIWASRPGRLKKLCHADRVLCILPFEEGYYRDHGIDATFVGNPLVNQLPPPESKESFCGRHGLDAGRTLIGLFPGSRRLEINYLLSEQIGAARLLHERFPNRFAFVLARASNLKDDFFARALARAGGSDSPPLKVLRGENHAILSACDLALLASGTVTLEAALYRTPMVVMYRGSRLVYWIARTMITVDHVAMPNLLAGREIVPELLQRRANAEDIADAAVEALEPRRLGETERQLDALARQFSDRDTPGVVAREIVALAREAPAERAVSLPAPAPAGLNPAERQRASGRRD